MNFGLDILDAIDAQSDVTEIVRDSDDVSFEEDDAMDFLSDPANEGETRLFDEKSFDAETKTGDEIPPAINQREYYDTYVKTLLNSVITKLSDKILQSAEKNDEIEKMRTLLDKGFPNWFLSNDRNRRSAAPPSIDKDSKGKSPDFVYEFVVYDRKENAFQTPFSDVYVNVVVRNKNYRANALRFLAEYLRDREPNAYIQEFLSDAKKSRRKIIFRYLSGKTKFIFMVNIELHLRLHTMFKLYTNVEDRFLYMGIFLSHWAHKRGILRDDYLNSNTLYLMIVYFLMVQNPPILPNIYIKGGKAAKVIRKKNPIVPREFYDIKVDLNYMNDVSDVKALRDKFEENELNVGELVTRFFYTFAYDIPQLKKRISIKKGRLEDPPRNAQYVDGYSVADPFIEEFDTCRNLNRSKGEGFKKVCKEFRRAYKCILDGKIQELCKEDKD